MTRWTLADIPWDEFDPARVDSDTVEVVKAASLVEYNGGEYAKYLCGIFSDDPDFQEAAKDWGQEEVRHGQALARWAKLADPDFDFEASFKRFTDGYHLPLDAKSSARGSRTGEFVARCMVEVGTSSFYSALRDSTDEPVLKAICEKTAADEVRHYKLFRTQMNRYLALEGVGFWRRLGIAISRLRETEDDELAYAYHAANGGGEPYDRVLNTRRYGAQVYHRYRLPHIEHAISMLLKAVGLRHRGWRTRAISRVAYWFVIYRARKTRAVTLTTRAEP